MTRQRNATTKRDAPKGGTCWSYIAGEKGRNRVRVFQRGSVLWVDYRLEDGRRSMQSLEHCDRQRAKEAADTLAAKFAREASRPTGVTTLKSLFDIYEREKTPGKAGSTQAHDRRTFPLLLRAFGSQRRPETLNVRDWTSFIERRRSGELSHDGREGRVVRAEIIRQDCKLLLAVLNWAERARDDRGGYLLDKNPLRGLAMPIEESPQRPVLSAEQFATVRAKAADLSMQAELLVLLLWFTGHRAASVRQLRWDDIDLEKRIVRWRAEVDKIAYGHSNPLHSELVPALSRARAVAELTGDVWLFPSPVESSRADSPSKPVSRAYVCKLWRIIADAAGIKAGSRIGTHSFRRAFASRLRDVPLRELKDLGGWKTEKTVIGTYLQPDEDAQRAALERLGNSTG